ncbi:MAG TPA: carboxypeptidase-like regulatory domain-containing protein, partial [Chitinophagales bacterium]|nr:carboxypeptidase-like regulatory domain-containing protein [Chitinophagales bacterium]
MKSKINWMVCWMFFGWMATAAAQSMSVSGMVQDAKTKEPLIGVNVVLYAPKDTVVLHSTTTDLDGAYWLSAVDTGAYTVEYSYISYKTLRRNITVSDPLILAPVSLEEESKLLKEVVIEDKQIRVQQLGDTSQFNAAAFKTNKDASTEELLVKMPGITSENGTMKVNGEEVKKILVDGKPYFGDDTRTAVQNLPAELIDKIQVFDRMSDQAAFTGFDDGNSEKTINIVTKSGVSDSKIGKFYAGYGGPDNRYNAGITFNAIKN